MDDNTHSTASQPGLLSAAVSAEHSSHVRPASGTPAPPWPEYSRRAGCQEEDAMEPDDSAMAAKVLPQPGSARKQGSSKRARSTSTLASKARPSARPSARKRPESMFSFTPSESQLRAPEGDLWEAECILEENTRKRTVLVQWKGVDAKGKSFKPSWESVDDCTPDLLRDWSERKARSNIPPPPADAQGSQSPDNSSRVSSTTRQLPIVKKKRRPLAKIRGRPESSPDDIYAFPINEQASEPDSSSSHTRKKRKRLPNSSQAATPSRPLPPLPTAVGKSTVDPVPQTPQVRPSPASREQLSPETSADSGSRRLYFAKRGGRAHAGRARNPSSTPVASTRDRRSSGYENSINLSEEDNSALAHKSDPEFASRSIVPDSEDQQNSLPSVLSLPVDNSNSSKAPDPTSDSQESPAESKLQVPATVSPRQEGLLDTAFERDGAAYNLADYFDEGLPQSQDVFQHIAIQDSTERVEDWFSRNRQELLSTFETLPQSTRPESDEGHDQMETQLEDAVMTVDVLPSTDSSTRVQTPEPPRVATPSSASHAMAGVLASGVASLPDNNAPADSISLEKYQLGEGEYPVPVGLREHQRQQYQQILMIHSSEILRFCDLDMNGKFLRERMVPNMMKVLNRSVLASTHPYLVVPSLLPRNLSEKDESRFIVHSGEKFRFLDNILKIFKDSGLKLGIVAREGLTMDLTATFLGGKRIKYVRKDGSVRPALDATADDTTDEDSDAEVFDKATVVLVPSSAHDVNDSKKLFLLPRVDLVIALDVSFDASELQVQQLRGVGSGKPLVPVIRLVPLNTAEHALLSVASFSRHPETVLDSAVLSSIFTSICLLRSEAGKVPDDIFKEVEALPAKLALWIRKGGRCPLPIDTHLKPQVNLLSDEDVLFTIKTYTPAEISEAIATMSNGSMVSELIDAIDSDSSRPFTASLGMALASMLKNTRAADAAVSSQLPAAKSIEPRLLEHNSLPRAVHDDAGSQSSVEADVAAHEPAADDADIEALTIDQKDKLIVELQESLSNAQGVLHLMESELANLREHHGNLLLKHENVDAMVQGVVKENSELQARVEAAESLMKKSEAEKERLKAEIAAIKARLAALQQLLLSGSPDLAELQTLRTRVEDLEDQKKKLQDKLESRDNELTYTRNEYQKASQAAAAAVIEQKELLETISVLRKKVDDERIKLRAMTWDAERAEKDREITKYKQHCATLEESIRRMQIDKQSSRGRYGVRSSSVPRRGISPATQSRASSPSTAGATPSSATTHPLQKSQGV